MINPFIFVHGVVIYNIFTEEYKKKQAQGHTDDSKSMSSLKWSTAQLKKVTY